MYEDYEYANDVSFAALEKAEAEKFTTALVDLDSRLCTPVQTTTSVQNSLTTRDNFPKYYSEGYDANHEGVEDSEILQWQRGAFTYMRVEGNAISLPSDTLHPQSASSFGGQDIPLANEQHFVEDLDILPRAADVMQDRSCNSGEGHTNIKSCCT